MRKLLNQTARNYISNRTGLEGDQLTLVGNAVYQIAANEDMPTLKQIGRYEGMSPPSFRKAMEEALGKAYYEKLSSEELWGARPSVENFLYALSAGLISSGFWIETSTEPAARKFVREWLRWLCPAERIGNKAEFRGYLTLLEYVWRTIDGTELRPGRWLSQRYSGNAQPSINLKAYFNLMIRTNPKSPIVRQVRESSRQMKPTVLLSKLRREIAEDWGKFNEEIQFDMEHNV